MKKLTLFFVLIFALGFSAFADWQTEVEQFEEIDRAVGYKGPAEMVVFLGGAAGDAPVEKGGLATFADDPAAFLESSGLGWTIFIILLGGFLLNLTPCVLPMIPVNIAIIGAGAQSESRAKGFALGATYGLGIAAVYGGLGLVAVLGGKSFGTLNANPWFNFGIAVVFIVLALSMFGVLHVDFSRFQAGKSAQFKSKFVTAFFMGGIAALLAGACVAPVVLAVLLLAGNLYVNGSVVGLLLPFLLGIGMALPWPFAGGGMSFLPKPGMWMEWVKRGFGVLILLMALYYGLLGAKLLGSVKTMDFASELASATADGKPVIVYFGAEWCKNCKQMDKDTWPDEAVVEMVSAYRFIKIDATKNTEEPVASILSYFDVQGLPTYIVMEPKAR